MDVAVALGLVAAIGPITRFRSPQKLVSYLGLNPDLRPIDLPAAGHIVQLPEVGGLHHRYIRQAA